MPPVIVKLADTILVNPLKVEVTPVSSTADTIKQLVYFVDKDKKKSLLAHLLKDSSIKSVLVFTRTKHGADRVVKDLLKDNIKAEAIHGNKSQNARQNALNNFKTGKTRVLIATDIAARGIDVDSLSHVINYEMPNIPETYVHRIGRTGRAGANGIAFSFCDAEEKAYLADIQKLIGKKIPVAEENPFEFTGKIPPPAPKQDRRNHNNNNSNKNNAPAKKQNSSPTSSSQENKPKPKKKWFNKDNNNKNY